MVAGNSDSIGRPTAFNEANALTGTGRAIIFDDNLLTFSAMVVMVRPAVNRMEDTVSGVLEAVTERVVFPFVVVVTHVETVTLGRIDGRFGLEMDFPTWSGSTLIFFGIDGLSALTVFAFGYVDIRTGVMSSWAVCCIKFSVELLTREVGVNV